jgi:hypothetical protein
LNPTAILAIISDLYAQVNALSEENAKLRAALAEKTPEGNAATS